MKLPENKDSVAQERCGSGYIPLKAWSCCDIAASNEEEAVGWWAGVLKKNIKCWYLPRLCYTPNNNAAEQENQTDKHRHQSLTCLLIQSRQTQTCHQRWIW